MSDRSLRGMRLGSQSTGKKAKRIDGGEEEPTKEKPVRTHWDMLLERRSFDELEVILKDRLNQLREARGETPKK